MPLLLPNHPFSFHSINWSWLHACSLLSLVCMHTRLSTSVLYFEHVLWNEISSRTTGNVGPVLGLGLDTPSQAAHMQPHLFQIDKYLLNRWANSWCMMNSFWKLSFCFRFVFLHILSKLQFGCMFKNLNDYCCQYAPSPALASRCASPSL